MEMWLVSCETGVKGQQTLDGWTAGQSNCKHDALHLLLLTKAQKTAELISQLPN